MTLGTENLLDFFEHARVAAMVHGFAHGAAGMANLFGQGGEVEAALDHFLAAANLGLISGDHCGMTYVHTREPTPHQEQNVT